MPAEISKDALIIIVSNRGPFSFRRRRNGELAYQRGEGGLVTALAALAERQDILWIAAALSKADRDWVEQTGDKPQQIEGMTVRLLRPSPTRYDRYYSIISNPLLWFIQHQLWDIPRQPTITAETWKAWRHGYVSINRSFADLVADTVQGIDRPVIIFPQDYHLYLLPQFLREKLGEQVQIQPFIHIPWPGPDAWRVLPHEIRHQLLTGLLASNRIGFQTRKDAFNFVQCCRLYIPDAHSRGSRDKIYYQDREIHARSYPISIDVKKVEAVACDSHTQQLKTTLKNTIGPRKLILRVDRIEPSKNILRGLQAYEALLEAHPEHQREVQLVALLVPSRIEVPEYQNYLQEIMALGGMINARYSEAAWEPVRIVVGNNYARALAAMQLYDVLLVNPIADGMNLVAKEGVLVNQRDGVLVLSEDAGVFNELGEQALAISPFDIYSTAEMLHQALIMPLEERRSRAEALRAQVKSADIIHWFNNQLDDAWGQIKSLTTETP